MLGVAVALQQAEPSANRYLLPSPPMNISSFELLKIAVDLARDRGIRRVDALRDALQQRYPSHLPEVDEALTLWASYVARHGS